MGRRVRRKIWTRYAAEMKSEFSRRRRSNKSGNHSSITPRNPKRWRKTMWHVRELEGKQKGIEVTGPTDVTFSWDTWEKRKAYSVSPGQVISMRLSDAHPSWVFNCCDAWSNIDITWEFKYQLLGARLRENLFMWYYTSIRNLLVHSNSLEIYHQIDRTFV